MRYPPLDRVAIIKQVKDFVWNKKNFRNQDLTAKDVAEAIGISRSGLLKVFREEMDMSFLDYVNDCRVRHSRKMVIMNNGRFSMEHIQVMSGFGNLYTFYSKYKRMYGESPKETDANNLKKKEKI